MNVRKSKGLACSMALDQDSSSRQELKGDVYNIFPYIRDPDPKKREFPMDRAFTLSGIIDATFFPITHPDELQGLRTYVRHEVTHCILSNAMITCEERALGAKLLGMVMYFLF